MSPSLPSIPQAVGLAYRDLAAVIRDLASLVAIAFVVMVATEVWTALIASTLPMETNAPLLIGFASGLVSTFLLTPYFIAIHRFIILGEAGSYALTARELRFQLYFTCWAAFSAATAAPLFLMRVLPTGLLLSLTVIWFIVVMVVGLRLLILFPAIAVDAPGATVTNALSDTKGMTWRIFIISLLGVLPIMLVGALIHRAGGVAGDQSAFVMVLRLAAAAVASMLQVTLIVVIASRLYQWLGDRLNRAT
jgi:hypothetical protein